MSDAHAHEHDHDAHHVNYLAIFVALCVFTALSIGTEIVPFPNHATLVVTIFAVASCKAFCVLAFFMHLKFEGNWKFLLLAPTTVLAIGLPIALMPDVGIPYYMRDQTQIDDYARRTEPHADDRDALHGDDADHDGGSGHGDGDDDPAHDGGGDGTAKHH